MYLVFNDFYLFGNGHIYNVLTLPNNMKLNVKSDKLVSTLPKVAHKTVEIDNINVRLLDVLLSNVDIDNIVFFNVDLTLSFVATSYQPKNNVKTISKYLLRISL